MRLVLAVAVFLAAAVPALAAPATVEVGDDFFNPGPTRVEPGETVTWNWNGVNSHTVQTRPRQIDRFNSGIKGGTGQSFLHAFKYRGRFRYYCAIHPDTMNATVQVGVADTVAPRITRIRTRVSGSRVKVTFKLSERSVLTAKVGRKKVVKTFGPGKHAVRFKGLRAGLHRVRLSAKDGFGNVGKKSKRFRTG